MSDDIEFIDNDSPILYDPKKAEEKEKRREQAKELIAKSGPYDPVIITKAGETKYASQLTVPEQEDEFVRCATDPIYFIETYLRIFDQTKNDGNGEIVPFKLFNDQKRLIRAIIENRFVVANKYRQAGISTCTCATLSWYVMFRTNRSIAIVADRLDTAKDELMNDVVEFIDMCPVWLRPKTGKAASSDGRFKDTQKLKRYDNGSELAAFSSKGLRGYTPTMLFWDETAWTEKSDKFWTSAKPTLQTGGSAIFVSTPNGYDSTFYPTFDGARKKDNNFVAVELWWFNDPRYNKNLVWYKNKDREDEIKLTDLGWDDEHRIRLHDDGWEPWSPWLDDEIKSANNDMRKIKQEIMCVFGNSLVRVKDVRTNEIKMLPISELYMILDEND